MTYKVSESSKRSFHSYVTTADESNSLKDDKQSSSQSLMDSIKSLFDQNRPRFSFREERQRSPVIGKVSPVRDARVLYQILDSDATNVVFSSWFLDRYQRIRPRRLTRLRIKEQKILTRHAKRLRQLLILTNQSKALQAVKPRRRRVSRAAYARRRKTAAQRRVF